MEKLKFDSYVNQLQSGLAAVNFKDEFKTKEDKDAEKVQRILMFLNGRHTPAGSSKEDRENICEEVLRQLPKTELDNIEKAVQGKEAGLVELIEKVKLKLEAKPTTGKSFSPTK